MAKRFVAIVFFVVGFCVVSTESCPALHVHEVREKILAVEQRWDHAAALGSEYRELIELVGSLMHIPGVLTTDCKSNLAVKGAALLALTTTNTKILAELLERSHGCLAKQCMYNVPKVLLYALASYYDYIRLTGKPRVLPDDLPMRKHLWASKMTQLFQLGVELLLRVFACVDKYDQSAQASPRRVVYLSELADWVELWRLLGRFGVLSEQDATFDARLYSVKQTLADKLNALSADLVEKSLDLSVEDELAIK